MSQTFFILKTPPISFSKRDLYLPEFANDEICLYIKSISDTFFLSNQFRKNHFLYFCTEYENKPYIVTFDGSLLRHLGPSFFSSAHLLLRAKNHIINPRSKLGKLTPGISVIEGSSSEVIEKYMNSNCVQIVSKNENDNLQSLNILNRPNVYFFGFEESLNIPKLTEISLGPLNIDEQIIVINYFIERDKP